MPPLPPAPLTLTSRPGAPPGRLNRAEKGKHTRLPLQELMSAVEVEMTARLGKPEEASKFSRQHLANSLWALATLERLPSGQLLIALAAAMQARASQCNPQEISNTVWACAKLGQPCSLLPCVLHFSPAFCTSSLRSVLLPSVLYFFPVFCTSSLCSALLPVCSALLPVCSVPLPCVLRFFPCVLYLFPVFCTSSLCFVLLYTGLPCSSALQHGSKLLNSACPACRCS